MQGYDSSTRTPYVLAESGHEDGDNITLNSPVRTEMILRLSAKDTHRNVTMFMSKIHTCRIQTPGRGSCNPNQISFFGDQVAEE